VGRPAAAGTGRAKEARRSSQDEAHDAGGGRAEPPRIQVEGPDEQHRYRAAHRRVTSTSADSHTSMVRDALVLGPWRADRFRAARDAEDLGAAFERRGAEGLAAALLAAEAAAAREAPPSQSSGGGPPSASGARGWELEVEARDDGSRRCRAVCRFDAEDAGAPPADAATVIGPWRPSRVRAEEDAAGIAAGFRRGGLRAARRAATADAAESGRGGGGAGGLRASAEEGAPAEGAPALAAAPPGTAGSAPAPGPRVRRARRAEAAAPSSSEAAAGGAGPPGFFGDPAPARDGGPPTRARAPSPGAADLEPPPGDLGPRSPSPAAPRKEERLPPGDFGSRGATAASSSSFEGLGEAWKLL